MKVEQRALHFKYIKQVNDEIRNQLRDILLKLGLIYEVFHTFTNKQSDSDSDDNTNVIHAAILMRSKFIQQLVQ